MTEVMIGILLVWIVILSFLIFSIFVKLSNENDNKVPITPITNTCEHSWHTLVDREQNGQTLVVIECVKCGSIDKNIIGRCNHEWDEYNDFTKKSKYEIAIEPIVSLARETFKYSKGAAKYNKVVDEITNEWFSNRKDAPEDLFNRTIIRTRTCKKCGEIFVLDLSQQSVSVQLMSQKPPIQEQTE